MTESVAEQIASAELDKDGRTPRSNEYKLGALAYLRYRAGERDRVVCPFDAGTPHFDAFFAGVDEGRELWHTWELAGHTQGVQS